MNKDFGYLQKKIDELLRCLGTEDLIQFLEIAKPAPDDKSRVSIFIINCVCFFYNIKPEEIFKAGGKTDVEPRMIISHLLKVYLKYSIREIGSRVNRKEEPVSRYLKDMNYYIDNPNKTSNNLRIVANYSMIETQVKEFIYFIEKQNTHKDEKSSKEQIS